jgi:hypothetical protein
MLPKTLEQVPDPWAGSLDRGHYLFAFLVPLEVEKI